MDYKKLHKNTLAALQQMVSEGKITEEIARSICADFVKESEDEKTRKELIERFKWELQGAEDQDAAGGCSRQKDIAMFKRGLAWLEKQGEQKSKHFELKAGHWYICHRAFCCRADNLTVKEGERFMCEKDGVVKGFVVKEPEEYFKEVCAPAPIDIEQQPSWNEDDENMLKVCLDFIDIHRATHPLAMKSYDWLRTLKERMKGE